MTKPRKYRMWAVFSPARCIVEHTVRHTRASAVYSFLMLLDVRYRLWSKRREDGYRVARVTVTEERK